MKNGAVEDGGTASEMFYIHEDEGSLDAVDPTSSAFIENNSPRSFYTESSRPCAVDTPQASQDEETQDAPVDDVSYDLSYSEYSTPIINVLVGLKRVTFSVHQGILCKSSVLAQACERLQNYNVLPLPEVDPEYFEMVVRFLYTGQYQNFRVPKQGHEDDLIAGFKIHAELYCLARKYELNDLALLIAAKMSIDDKISFKNLVEIARVIYPKLHHDDVLFSAYFNTEASRAIVEYPRLAEEPWVLDIFQNGGGRLAIDLFKAFVLNLTDKGSANGGTTPKPETDPKITTDSATSQCKDREELELCPENENTLSPTDNAPDYQADQPETLPSDAIINFDGPYESLAPNPVNAVTLSSHADGAANCDLGEASQKAEEIRDPWGFLLTNGNASKGGKAKKDKSSNRTKAKEELVIPERHKKDKKSKKGKEIETEEKAALIEEPAIYPVEDNSPENGQFMVDWAVPMPPPVEEVVDDLQGWGDFSTKKKVKKGTKDKKKGVIEMEDPPFTDGHEAMFSNPAPNPPIKSKKSIKGKSTKKEKSVTEVVTEAILLPAFVDPAYPATCAFRSSHLKDEEKWSNCDLCREEVKKIALDLAKEHDALDVGI